MVPNAFKSEIFRLPPIEDIRRPGMLAKRPSDLARVKPFKSGNINS